MMIPSLVPFECRRGPRTASEVALQEAPFPSEEAIRFGPTEAIAAADLYRSVRHPRSREGDLAIAARAIVRTAELWNQNQNDFIDIPGLRVLTPR